MTVRRLHHFHEVGIALIEYEDGSEYLAALREDGTVGPVWPASKWGEIGHLLRSRVPRD